MESKPDLPVEMAPPATDDAVESAPSTAEEAVVRAPSTTEDAVERAPPTAEVATSMPESITDVTEFMMLPRSTWADAVTARTARTEEVERRILMFVFSLLE